MEEGPARGIEEPVEEPAPAAPVNILDELIAESIGESCEEIAQFRASTGRVFRYRVIRDAEEIARIMRSGRQLAGHNPAALPPAWRPFYPITQETALNIAYMEAALLDPQLGTLDLLTWARRSGLYFLEIATEIRGASLAGLRSKEREILDELGNA